MSAKNKKQFGIWMDTEHATILGRENEESKDFSVIAHINNEDPGVYSSEKVSNNAAQMLTMKFFKEITSHMQNVDELHVTGTGKSQEQFINYLSETPQYKNTQTTESTNNKMSDDELVKYISEKYN